MNPVTYLQLLSVFLCDGKNIGDVIGEPQVAQRSLDVFAGNSLLCFLFADVVRLGGNQSDELDAALHKQVAGVLGEGLAGGGGEDL